MSTCLVTGVGPVNKGAELMLIAIHSHFIKAKANRRLVLDSTSGSFEWRSSFQAWQFLDTRHLGRLGRFRTMFFHAGYRQRFGIVTLDQVNVLLDASGFAFGDNWKPEWINASAARFEAARRAGAMVVLMPQAFGPLTLPAVRKGVERVLASVDLVFARDQSSYGYCREHMDRHERLILSPDFTNLVEPRRIEDWPSPSVRVGIVPNMQMLRQGSPEAREAYLPQMEAAIAQLLSAGYDPWVIVHESNDLALCKDLAGRAKIPERVVHCDRADQSKFVLGQCQFVIGSRFHALISALSQGIPCVGLSWSHKYEELFGEYGLPEMVFRPGDPRFQDAITQLYDERRRGLLSERISKKSAELKSRVAAMWEMIETKVSQHGGSR